MSTKTENSRSLLTRAALSTGGRAKANSYQYFLASHRGHTRHSEQPLGVSVCAGGNVLSVNLARIPWTLKLVQHAS